MSETPSAPELRAEVSETGARVMDALRGGRRTAWEIKLELKVSHTLLHLALGQLLEQGKVSLRPEKLTYMIEPAQTASGSEVLTARAPSGSAV